MHRKLIGSFVCAVTIASGTAGQLEKETTQRPALAPPIRALSDHTRAPGQQSLVSSRNGRLSVTTHDRTLQSILDEICRVTDVAFLVLDKPAKDRLISLQIRDVPIDEALRLLLRDQDAFFFYGVGKEGLASLRTVWVYPRGGGGGLEPLSRDSLGTITEPKVALGDFGLKARSPGLEALVGREGRQANEALMEAVREEKNDELRTQILYKALDTDIELSEDFLSSLVLSDPAPEVRLLALDALSRSPEEAEGVAEQTLNDPDESVRTRAHEILEELHPASPSSTEPAGSDQPTPQ